MAADPLSNVAPGDSVLDALSQAGRINAWNDAARRVRNGFPRERPKDTAPPVSSIKVKVRNDTGADLEAFSVVSVPTGTPLVDWAANSNALQYEFQDYPAYSVNKPTSGTDQPLILAEPIPADGIGLAVIHGHTLCRVQVPGSGYRYARPIKDDVDKLKASPGGPVRIIKPVDVVGSQILCSVFLDADAVDGWFTLGHDQFVSDAWVAYGSSGAATFSENVTILYEPGYYELVLPFFGEIAARSGVFANTNGGSYNGRVRINWGRAVNPGGSQPVCTGASFAIPSTSLTLFRRVNLSASGAGVLTLALRLSQTLVPYQVAVTWLGTSDSPDGGPGASAFNTNWRAQIGLGNLLVARVPGIMQGGMSSCDTASWSMKGESQPSVPSCDGGADAVADDYTVPAGGVLNVPPPGVVGNDTVPAGYGPVLDSSPTLGDLTFNSDGSFTYKQTGSLAGLRPPATDTFSYHLSNGVLGTPPATVTITITEGGSSGTSGFSPTTGGSSSATSPDTDTADPSPDSGSGST